ncbi:MAG: hypothetical protein Q8Q09_28395 [Deltaproteobacteria bacterium]|nr:hypothetical protein [Deltaproteobacteria bacterium]
MVRSKTIVAHLALVSLSLAGCERARRVVHAAASDPGAHPPIANSVFPVKTAAIASVGLRCDERGPGATG